MFKHKTRVELPSVGLSGFEPPLGEDEAAVQSMAHRFAKEVLRPVGRELDRRTAEEVVAASSPLWAVYAGAAKLGFDQAAVAELPAATAARMESLFLEELGWGDAGLAVSIGAAGFPAMMAGSLGNQELLDLCQDKIGCWMITHPDVGSDAQMYYAGEELAAGHRSGRANAWAKVGQDELVVNGQCSAWVSNGAIAQVAVAYIGADYGDGRADADGRAYGVGAIIPLDLPGVTHGKPLEKIGQRGLPQGEIYFDNVKIPKRFAFALRDEYWGSVYSIWSQAGTLMAQVFTGAARAAFELALAYCHERKQGGSPLIEHQMTRFRLGDMLRRVELCRAVARRSLEYARSAPATHPFVTAAAKVTVTEEALKVATEALQLHGANGTTREYPIEKIFRDCRSALIEDGENNVLTMRLGILAGLLYEQGWTKS